MRGSLPASWFVLNGGDPEGAVHGRFRSTRSEGEAVASHVIYLLIFTYWKSFQCPQRLGELGV